MTDPVETIAMRLRDQPDRPFSVLDAAEELGLARDRTTTTIEVLARRDGFFDLGGGRMIFSSDADRVAYEIFRSEAPNITYEEYQRYRDDPHILMRMSRDRDVADRANPEKRLRELMKEKDRGNRF
ncbi:MAG: hypothetical protein AYK23_02895 [Candidatus Proteinoplasmatales archaeon SG8-5]|nr:MAG: hypothetical protein AYK23_02895 [Candidatus Proteinoplasmatales archaeon SG8-5]